jgi:hypothetical protein
VQVIALHNFSQTTIISGFVAKYVNGSIVPAKSSPDGMIAVPDRNELWVGDGDGVVKVVSLANNSIVAKIDTGSVER